MDHALFAVYGILPPTFDDKEHNAMIFDTNGTDCTQPLGGVGVVTCYPVASS